MKYSRPLRALISVYSTPSNRESNVTRKGLKLLKPVTSGTLADGQVWTFKGRSRAAVGDFLAMTLSNVKTMVTPKALSV
jgi:hypothetical protein